MAGFILEHALAHFGGFFALLSLISGGFCFSPRRINEAEPIAAGFVAFLRENFDDVAASDFVAQRNHLAIHFRADALVADFGVDHVSKSTGVAPRGSSSTRPLGVNA